MNKQVKIKAAETFKPNMEKETAERMGNRAKIAKDLHNQFDQSDLAALAKFKRAISFMSLSMSELMPLDYHDVADWSESVYEVFHALDDHPELKTNENLASFWKSVQENFHLEREFSEGTRYDFRLTDRNTFALTDIAYRNAFDASISQYQADHLDHFGINREGLEVTS